MPLIVGRQNNKQLRRLTKMNKQIQFYEIFAGHLDCKERQVGYLEKIMKARSSRPKTKKQHFKCPWMSDK
jgi:hypothetical protein